MKCQVQMGYSKYDHCDKPAVAQVTGRHGKRYWVCREHERMIQAEKR